MSESLLCPGLTEFRAELTSLRGRLIDGMAQAVADRGYARATVSDVLSASGTSRKTFYAHFGNKEECFLAAYDVAVAHVSRSVVRTFVQEAPHVGAQVHAALSCFMGWIVAEPAFARLCLVEALAAGPRGLARRSAAMARFTAFVEEASTPLRTDAGTPRMVPEAIVGGLQAVISTRVLEGRAHELPGLVDDLLVWALVPFQGDRPAEPAAA